MYTFITNRDSPNFTPASEARATWGVPRTIEKIAIHWWGDPSNNPTFEGIVSYLCSTAAGVSAHFVATGTNRRVACIVDPKDASWATNSANPYTISIECDPRCRDEDYDVVGELVAELRATYGNLPLIGHRDVVATRCPGNYDLNRINAVAATKLAKATDQYGLATNKVAAPAPTPVPDPVPTYVPAQLNVPIEFSLKQDSYLWDIPTNKPTATLLKKGAPFRAFASIAAYNKTYYITEYSYGKGVKNGVEKDLLAPKEAPVPIPAPIPEPTPTPAPTDIDARLRSVEETIKKIKDL